MMAKIKYTSEFIEGKIDEKPKIALILGSGLGDMAENIDNKVIINYSEIPDFPVSKVKGHKNRLVIGEMFGKRVIAMQGRFHYYEGYSMGDIALPVRVFKKIGVKTLIVTNAAGGLNPHFKVGDLMVINDHINFMGNNPLIGPNLDEMGPRFPAMTGAYNKVDFVKKCAHDENVPVVSGTYVAVTGPTYETPAEQRMYKMFGDAIGMSTVPEVIAAKHCGYDNIIGISLITNVLTGTALSAPNHKEVVEAADKAKNYFQKLIGKIIKEI